MCNCDSILECCVMFSGVKLSIRSFNLFIHSTFCTLATIGKCVDMIFIDLSDNSFVITEFEYFFTVFVYDISVLSCDFVFVNDCVLSNLLFYYFAEAIVI